MALLPTLQEVLDPMPSTDKQQSKGAHMKVIAIGNIGKAPTPEQRQQIMPREVPATLKLYLDGKIEQFWFRQDKPGVVFLMNVESLEQAKADRGSTAARHRRLRHLRADASRSARAAGHAHPGQVTARRTDTRRFHQPSEPARIAAVPRRRCNVRQSLPAKHD
ncbi:hypothetical protein ACVWZR_001733 [Bradyrhizobium sp. i1.3.1]